MEMGTRILLLYYAILKPDFSSEQDSTNMTRKNVSNLWVLCRQDLLNVRPPVEGYHPSALFMDVFPSFDKHADDKLSAAVSQQRILSASTAVSSCKIGRPLLLLILRRPLSTSVFGCLRICPFEEKGFCDGAHADQNNTLNLAIRNSSSHGHVCRHRIVRASFDSYVGLVRVCDYFTVNRC
jgi:hypothetical protein